MWTEDVDDSEFVGGSLVSSQQAYIKEYRCNDMSPQEKAEILTEMFNKGKTMDSAKKSVEKILEIAKKHGYACVVGFRKMDRNNTCPEELPDMWSGATGLQKEIDALMYDSIEPMWDHYKDGVKDGE